METICRCGWCNLNNPLYVAYHDREWGVPQHEDGKLFELLILESFQAGLSWEQAGGIPRRLRRLSSGEGCGLR